MTNSLLSIAVTVISTCACVGQNSPLACNLKAFTPEERQEWRSRIDQFKSAVTSWQELRDGYRFRLDPARAPLAHLGRWVDLERKCCPFLDFQLDLHGEDGSVWLTLKGREGVKQFIHLDFSLDKLQH
jgi:hypothetical protein